MESLRKLYQLIRKVIVYIPNKILLHDLFVNNVVYHNGLHVINTDKINSALLRNFIKGPIRRRTIW